MCCQKKHGSQCPLLPQTCNEKMEKECMFFQPFPPRMTNEEFSKEQTDILKDIPPELKSALSYMAYESGHSAGYEEVIIHLRDLVSNLTEPLKNYEARIRKESQK